MFAGSADLLGFTDLECLGNHVFVDIRCVIFSPHGTNSCRRNLG